MTIPDGTAALLLVAPSSSPSKTPPARGLCRAQDPLRFRASAQVGDDRVVTDGQAREAVAATAHG